MIGGNVLTTFSSAGNLDLPNRRSLLFPFFPIG